MDQQERSSQCGLACGHTYSSPSWPSRWQPPWSCPPGAPPLPQTPSPASLGQVEPPVAQSSASKVQEKCAEGHGIGRQFLSLSPTFFVTLHFSFYCTTICSSKCLIGQTEKVESISRYGKCAEGLICSGCHRCQVEEKKKMPGGRSVCATKMIIFANTGPQPLLLLDFELSGVQLHQFHMLARRRMLLKLSNY